MVHQWSEIFVQSLSACIKVHISCTENKGGMNQRILGQTSTVPCIPLPCTWNPLQLPRNCRCSFEQQSLLYSQIRYLTTSFVWVYTRHEVNTAYRSVQWNSIHNYYCGILYSHKMPQNSRNLYITYITEVSHYLPLNA